MQDPASYLAQALKELRTRRAWSLDQTARKTGVSKAMLGQIERAESSPTIATLWKIANGFQTPVSSFLTPPVEMSVNGSIGSDTDRYVRGLTVEPGIVVRSLFSYDARFGFEMLELVLLPGTVRLSEPHAAGVTEHVVIISGPMELLVDGRWNVLPKGSAVRFAADRPHGYRNLTMHPAIFHNLIHYPADYEEPVGDPGLIP